MVASKLVYIYDTYKVYINNHECIQFQYAVNQINVHIESFTLTLLKSYFPGDVRKSLLNFQGIITVPNIFKSFKIHIYSLTDMIWAGCYNQGVILSVNINIVGPNSDVSLLSSCEFNWCVFMTRLIGIGKHRTSSLDFSLVSTIGSVIGLLWV